MDDAVFGALADPTRRRLLDQLFERDGRTLGELVEAVPEMTRFGVMKHLRVLGAADLVITRRAGRQTFHYLNAVPIRRLQDRWIDKYRARAADALLALQSILEEAPMTTATAPAHVFSTYIRATPKAIWQAITSSESTRRYYYGSSIDATFEPGSSYRMTIGDELQIDGTIVEAEPPRRLVQTFHAAWDQEVAADPASRVTWEIEETAPGVCRVTVIHEGLAPDSATRRQVSGGWPYILAGLKSLLETGTGLGDR